MTLTTDTSQLHIHIIVLDEIRYCMYIELWLDKTGFCSDIYITVIFDDAIKCLTSFYRKIS
jgi:hypothetical protein